MRPAPASVIAPVLAALLAAVAGGARADVALVLANGEYENLPDLPAGESAAGATAGLAALGFEVVRVADGDREETSRALARLATAAREEGRVVVVLSGRFATDGERTWLLTTDSRTPTLFSLNSNAVSVESVLAVLADHPSRALLLLARDPEAGGELDPWLREGLGAIDVPQGVTLVTGTPRSVEAFVAGDLARPQGDLAAALRGAEDLAASGYLPSPFRLMPAPPEPEAPVVVVPDAPTAAEAALWQGAVALDTVDAYRNYLRVYPQGAYVEEARAALDSLLSEPDRAARLAEEALRLSGGQRTAIQRDLATLDYDPRGIDGVFGPGTRAAIVNWQQENGFPQTSYLDAEQVSRLSEQARERLESEEAERRAAEAADEEFWRRNGAGGTVEGLRAYLARYPEGRHADEAADRLEALAAAARTEAQAYDAAAREGTAAAWARFLEAHPDSSRAAEARAARRAAEAREAAAQQAASGAATQAARAAEASLGLTPLTARVIEARLAALDLSPGDVDGTFDEATRQALGRFQQDAGLARTGYLDEATLVRLVAETLGLSLGD